MEELVLRVFCGKFMDLRNINSAEIKKGQRALVRVDFDVAIEKGKIKEDFRLRAALPTIRFLLQKGALVRLLAHLDRPEGKIVPVHSLKKIIGHLARALRRKIIFITDPLADDFLIKYNFSKEIILFENMRFWPGEEANDKSFARSLSCWGDIYVNDAFANSHRAHASMSALARILPSFSGLALSSEVLFLSGIKQNPARPFFVVLGGAKLETKLPLLKAMLKIADGVLLGGALVTPLLDHTSGVKIMLDTGSDKMRLPTDVWINKNSKPKIVRVSEMRDNDVILDIGPETVTWFVSLLKKSKTVVWNGPLGMAEKKEFSAGTVGVARGLQKIKALKIVGGGDTVALLRKYGVLKNFSHISLGGGAMLEFLAGEKLPGLEVLKKR